MLVIKNFVIDILFEIIPKLNLPSDPFNTSKMALSKVKTASESEHFDDKEATQFLAFSLVSSSFACN